MTLFDKIKDALDIETVIRDEGVDLVRKGNRLWAPCPFHAEVKPSFSVTPRTRSFYCFGCKAGGSVIDFIIEKYGGTPFDAAKYLIEKYNLPIKITGQQTHDKKSDALKVLRIAREYFSSKAQLLPAPLRYMKKRGFSYSNGAWGYCPEKNDEFFQKLPTNLYPAAEEIGLIKEKKYKTSNVPQYYMPLHNRIIFNINTVHGQTIGFAGRAIDDDDNIKYLNSPQSFIFNKSNALYMIEAARRPAMKAGVVIIVEGYFDAMRLHELGYTNTIATCGTALSNANAKTLAGLADEVIIFYDDDNAGKKAAITAAITLLHAGTRPRIATPSKKGRGNHAPTNGDPDTIGLNSPSELQSIIENATDPVQLILNAHPNPDITQKQRLMARLTPFFHAAANPTVRNIYKTAVEAQLGVRVSSLGYRKNENPNNETRATSDETRTPPLEHLLLAASKAANIPLSDEIMSLLPDNLQSESLDDAISTSIKLLAATIDEPETLLKTASERYIKQRCSEKIEALNKLLTDYPNDPGILKQIADLHKRAVGA